ncbi:MAG: L-2-amino-thiazoline-4-carboxylic acid hydrolase [Oscillospiraceae bacterium]|nr:L-2-amino-thiazoline-4-carboxylic acid hydrolase [Oscillospiraceae bacterium]
MIKNTPTDRGQHIDDLRGAIEHRATWFYLLIKEAKKRGLDYDFARDAIFSCGAFHGGHKFAKTDNLVEFGPTFATENVKNIFEMDVTTSPEEMYIEFHYCPLVSAWQKLGATEEEIEILCDIAMDGDRGIASAYPAFEFELGKTIAKGDDVCQVWFRKKK